MFPESVTTDPATGDAYTGSMADGTLLRMPAGGSVAEVFSPAGDGGRGSVAGVKVDSERRLWAAGGYDGALWIYDLGSGAQLAGLGTSQQPTCTNDIAFGPDGTAYLTDSFAPTLFRIPRDLSALEPWADLAAAGVPWPEGLNFNGVVLCADAGHLVCCQTTTGRYWRVALGDGAVDEVALDGGPLPHSDGLAVDGDTLYAAVNARNEIAVIALARDGSSGRVTDTIASDAFAFPTSIVVSGDRLLVLNAQLDKMGGDPELPFTVVAVARPGRS